MPDVLNLGAGNRIIAGALNVDIWKHRPEIDFVWDLNDLPWPWGDNTFRKIAAIAVFEHLHIGLIEAMDECWRILRPKGIAVVKLPHWRSNATYIDPTHYQKGFALETMHTFDPTTEFGTMYAFYTPRKWRIVKGPRLNASKSSIWTTLQVIKGKD